MPKQLLSGLRFGMLLQLAVGPVCLFVANAALTAGFWPAMGAVAAVTITDAAYIALSAVGAAALFAKPAVRKVARIVGGAVLCLFGLDMALGAFQVQLLPGIRLFAADAGSNLFLQALLITASNPLTILFWGGALTAKVAGDGFTRHGLVLFSAGCVLATFLFLTTVAALGGVLTGSLSAPLMAGLNAAIGLMLAGFGIRLIMQKEKVAA